MDDSKSDDGRRKIHLTQAEIADIGAPGPEINKLLFKPKAFMVENQKLDQQIIEASAQLQSLEDWTADPRRPQTYICAGNPDDVKARYFAMYLAVVHARWYAARGKRSRVLWTQMYGSFDNPAMHSTDEPTLLVIDNLSALPNKLKFDKTRDLIARYDRIPRILVVAGEDPISFAACRIYKPCNALAYFPGRLAKATTQII